MQLGIRHVPLRVNNGTELMVFLYQIQVKRQRIKF